MIPGDFFEVLGLPPRVPWVMHRNGVRQVKVEGRWVDVRQVWRPAIYAGPNGHGHAFRWTDNLHFVEVPDHALRTVVRQPTRGTASQEKYWREWGDLW